MSKLIEIIKKNIKEIVLILVGLIVGYSLTRREKEQKLTEKMNKAIDGTKDISDKQKQIFQEQLDRINGITDDKKRMEAKLKLCEFLNE